MLSGRSDIDFDQIFLPFDFSSRRAVIAAVSGGSDSLAMLLLLRRWLATHAPQTSLVAVTVDHSLRPESAGEAEGVARLCAMRGIAHTTMIWTEPKPVSGLAAAARLARYGLLADAAAGAETDLIVTGHTADDQAETVAMRQARGDGHGLAGMAPATLFESRAWILRPLLGVGREELRDFLRGEGVGWVDDPSNTDARYERPRIRAALGREGGARAELLATAAAASSSRVEIGYRIAGLIEQHVTRPLPGLLRIAPGFFDASDRAWVYALRLLLAVTGGVAQLPDALRVTELFDRSVRRATLARTVIDRRREATFLYRERRGLPAPRPVGDRLVWDGRYLVSASQQNVIVTAGGGSIAGEPESRQVADVPASLARAALSAEPRFAGIDGTPLPAGALSVVPLMAPWRQFLPCFDVFAAKAVSRLIGRPEIPSPPWAGHNKEEA